MDTHHVDLLISRALDRAATPSEWEDIERLAAAEASVAAELVRGLRREGALMRGIEAELARADAIELPRAPAARPAAAAWRRHSGWLAAGVLAVAWAVESLPTSASAPAAISDAPALVAPGANAPVLVAEAAPPNPGETALAPVPVAGPVAGTTMASDASSAALGAPAWAPAALGEMPLMMLESRPLDGGGWEVLYLRRVIERRVVEGMLQLANDESGQPRLIPASGPPSGSARFL